MNTFLPKHFLTLTSVLTLNCFFMRTNNVQRKDRTLVLMIFCFTYKYPPYFGGIVLIKTSIKVSVVDPFITKIHQKTMAIPRSKRRSIILPSDPDPSLTIKITPLPPTKKMQVNLWHHLNQFTLEHQKALGNYLLQGTPSKIQWLFIIKLYANTNSSQTVMA